LFKLTRKYIKWFDEISKKDIPLVGGKGANLGELTIHDVHVPPGYCVTAQAYSDFIDFAGLKDEIRHIISTIDFEDSDDLTGKCQKIRDMILSAAVPQDIEAEISSAYEELCTRTGVNDLKVAVRSSATAEDLPDASFAGQQDTYLHIRTNVEVLSHVKKCWASLWTARATYYREKQGFDHFEVSLSAVVQKMVNSGKSGVMFTANPISNELDEIMINSSWGLGEAVVSGSVTPDEYIISKKTSKVTDRIIAEKKMMIIDRKDTVGTMDVNVGDHLGKDYITRSSLDDSELMELLEAARNIESIYSGPMDVEWALDNDTSELYILQARPITTLGEGKKEMTSSKEEKLNVLVRGLAASPGVAAGPVVIIRDMNEIARVNEGDILVTGMTNPDMVPAMRKAAAVVTDEGGRTCHAAIVSRELGIPCIVGSKDGTKILKEDMVVTVDATRGVVFEGKTQAAEKALSVTETTSAIASEDLVNRLAPITGTKIYMNLGEPSIISKYLGLPFDGIGLMRTEFIFSNMVGIHPMYLVKTNQGKLLIDKMAEGITAVAQQIYPRPVVVRLSDFRTNEFRGLKGGEEVEPIENNPMIGWRGVSRYISNEYEEGFRLECKAIRKVREEFGLINVWVMLPFVRTTWELERVKSIMASEGLVQNSSFKLWIMAEVPSVVFAAEEFAQMVDGFSIGSNDLTQLVMGVDRDSGILNNMGYFDERNISVQRAIEILIKAAHKYGKTCSICGQGPSLYPDFAEFLVRQGIDSMSINPDTVAYTRKLVASVEQKIILGSIR
jgi:pyruvate,water dikinase